VIRKRLVLEKDQALTIFFANNKLQQNEKLMSQIYEECKDQDGFLYCKYANYEVYGAIDHEWSPMFDITQR
jgi:GABA(A) receptor-associated protein